MKITKKELIDMDACSTGLRRFAMQTNDTNEPVEVMDLIGGINTMTDLVWLAGETFPKDKIVRFACDCALIESTGLDDEIVEFLKNPNHDHAESIARSAAFARVKSATLAARAAGVSGGVYGSEASNAAVYAGLVARGVHKRGDADVRKKVNELLVELFYGEK